MPLKRTEDNPWRKTRQAASRRYLIFSVGEMDYAVELRHVKHSLRASGHQDPEVALHGQTYPKVDVRSLFGLPPSIAAHRMILAVEASGARAALIVDAVVSLTSIEDGQILPLPHTFDGVEREWFAGIIRLDDRVAALIRVSALLQSCGRPIPAMRFRELAATK